MIRIEIIISNANPLELQSFTEDLFLEDMADILYAGVKGAGRRLGLRAISKYKRHQTGWTLIGWNAGALDAPGGEWAPLNYGESFPGGIYGPDKTPKTLWSACKGLIPGWEKARLIQFSPVPKLPGLDLGPGDMCMALKRVSDEQPLSPAVQPYVMEIGHVFNHGGVELECVPIDTPVPEDEYHLPLGNCQGCWFTEHDGCEQFDCYPTTRPDKQDTKFIRHHKR